LKTGQMAGAACDVFTEEPVTSKNPLLTLDNFVAAPHLGANTEEALRRVGMAAVDGLLKRLNIEMELNK
jgi:D-3-phosphoglycerate dehydrogenase